MKCPKCGQENAKGIQFCVKCGGPVGLALGIEKSKLEENPFKEENANNFNKHDYQYENISHKELNSTDKYLENERIKQEKRESIRKTKQDISRKMGNVPNNIFKNIKKAFTAFIIAFVILFVIGSFTGESDNSSYDYNEEIVNAVENGNVMVEFEVPDGLYTSNPDVSLSKNYYDEDFYKSVNYSLYTGDLKTTLQNTKDSYQKQIDTGQKYSGTIKQDKMSVNGNDVEYIVFKYKTSSYSSSLEYTTIVGFVQIKDYLYKIVYNDYASGDLIDLEELFTFDIIED